VLAGPHRLRASTGLKRTGATVTFGLGGGAADGHRVAASPTRELKSAASASGLWIARIGEVFAATLGAPATDGQAQACVRMSTALTPKRSGAAEGVGEGRRPTPVQIDDSGRRWPFSDL
jgi:hypothetical protein